MTQSNSNLSAKLHNAQERRTQGKKKYTLYRLSKDAGVDYGHVYRVMHGQSTPSRDVLTKICNALECNPQERAEIFHAAGLLALEEMEEEPTAA